MSVDDKDPDSGYPLGNDNVPDDKTFRDSSAFEKHSRKKLLNSGVPPSRIAKMKIYSGKKKRKPVVRRP